MALQIHSCRFLVIPQRVLAEQKKEVRSTKVSLLWLAETVVYGPCSCLCGIDTTFLVDRMRRDFISERSGGFMAENLAASCRLKMTKRSARVSLHIHSSCRLLVIPQRLLAEQKKDR